jgi:hypothetical protein
MRENLLEAFLIVAARKEGWIQSAQPFEIKVGRHVQQLSTEKNGEPGAFCRQIGNETPPQLTGNEDLNDAPQLAQDPTLRLIGSKKI